MLIYHAMKNNPTSLQAAVSPTKADEPIKSIARWEFNQLLPQHLVLENLMGEQFEWFADPANKLIGTIAFARMGRSWNFAILQRDKVGDFQLCKFGQNNFTLEQTIVQFRNAVVTVMNRRQEIYRPFLRAVAPFTTQVFVC